MIDLELLVFVATFDIVSYKCAESRPMDFLSALLVGFLFTWMSSSWVVMISLDNFVTEGEVVWDYYLSFVEEKGAV